MRETEGFDILHNGVPRAFRDQIRKRWPTKPHAAQDGDSNVRSKEVTHGCHSIGLITVLPTSWQ
jgi:hypothetical protein